MTAKFDEAGETDWNVRPIPFAEPGEYSYMEATPKAALIDYVRSGDMPHVRTASFFTGKNLTIEELEVGFPPGSAIERSLRTSRDVHILVKGETYAFRLETYPDCVRAEIAASRRELADFVEATLRMGLEKVAEPTATVRFTSWVQGEPPDFFEANRVRWEDVSQNYPTRTATQLASLMSMTRETRRTGRIIVFHGEPGTGKTWAIRALATEWSDFCIPELVLDPDQAFSSASYLRGIASSTRKDQARLLICEDVDGIVTSRRTGGFERLLNVTDGILGQGQDLTVLISTNVRPNELDRALIRPGRCLAQVTFERFSASEVNSRLGAGGSGRTMTLAELFEAEGTVHTVRDEKIEPSIGAYL